MNIYLTEQDVIISFYEGEPLFNMSFVKEIVKYLEQIKHKSRHSVNRKTNVDIRYSKLI